MSNTNSTDSPPNNTLLSNLRHFRFQKKSVPKGNNDETPSVESISGNVGAESKSTASNGEKVLKETVFSSSNGTLNDEKKVKKSPNKTIISPDVLKDLKEAFPTINPLVLERNLIKCKGNVAATKALLKELYNNGQPPATTTETSPSKPADENKKEAENVANFKSKLFENFNKKCLNNQGLSVLSKPLNSSEQTLNTSEQTLNTSVKRTFSEAHNNAVKEARENNKKFKKDEKVQEYDESGDSEDDIGYSKQDRRVFDSDEDSDVEISDDMNADQRQVYEFLSTAGLSELLCMSNCSQKKAEAIIEQRPFTGWKNMVKKFQEGKNLGTEILNSAQEVLYTRHVVNQLMQKCSRLAVEMERAISTGTSNITVQPKLLNPSLKLASYQMVGLNWLIVLHNRGLNGILADEMGLGKTVQIIAFLALLRETAGDDEDHENRGPHLIVVPSSTMENWSNELERWCPSLKVHLYYGLMEERKAMRIQFAQQGIKHLDVILTTCRPFQRFFFPLKKHKLNEKFQKCEGAKLNKYNLITSTPEERKMFKVLPFNYVIFDEAHMLKNMNTQRFENLMRVNAKHRILLTGTPLQNNLLELMSLLTFVMPEMFEKKKEYLKCLFTKNTRTKATETPKESLPRFEQEQVAQAKKIMQPFVLRRLKKDVLKDLPKKTEDVVYCTMTEKQRTKYKNLIAMFSKRAERKEMKEDIDEGSGMSMMMDLRKLSNHPLLLRDIYDDEKLIGMAKILAKERDYKETNVDYIVEDLSAMSDFQLHSLCKSFKSLSKYELDNEDILGSGKFEELDRMLPKLKAENHRVLIFSQFVIMLNVIEEYLKIRDHKYLRLDGSTQVTIRQELIDNFNEDPSIFIFILSTRAGGLGINLTAADTVIIHDIDFNPYNDKQAEDRCHRVGQTRPVTVSRFISKDSIEESIYQVALEKLSLEREISSEENEQSELKSVVSLLKKVLGVEGTKASPQKKPSVKVD